MKTIIGFILVLAIVNFTKAQSTTEEALIKRACMDYLEGFYLGDTAKIINSISPTLHKFGFWKDANSGEYAMDGYMTFEQAKSYAKRVKEKEKFAKEDAPKIVEVLDIMHQIAAAKITAWWGVDYVLLSKKESKWMIEQVLWEGPLEK
jgi:hypothetical protein